MVATRRDQSWPRSIRLRCVERVPRDGAFQFVFDVVERDGRRFAAYARALPSGLILDLQGSDNFCAGTTGPGGQVVDALVAEGVRRRLANARADVAIADFDRGGA